MRSHLGRAEHDISSSGDLVNTERIACQRKVKTSPFLLGSGPAPLKAEVFTWDLIVNQNVFIERFLTGRILGKLTDEEMNRYREPFLEPKSRKPVWRWPNEIPNRRRAGGCGRRGQRLQREASEV